MKIAFVFGPFTIGNRHIDFTKLWDSPRGLTGSELSCISMAREMAKLGHSVSFFVQNPNAPSFDGVQLREYGNLPSESYSYDAVYSWMGPDDLRGVDPRAVRLVNQQLNDFGYCRPGYDSFVDIYTSPSQSHMEYIRGLTPSPHKWTVLPNGCNPDLYDRSAKVPGRVIYASSPDRGLHLLLQAWPHIKKRAPHAHLRVFYNMEGWITTFLPQEDHQIPDFVEFGRRARYIDLSMRRMSSLGVERVGSVSRNRMDREMSEAEVLAYPCDTVRFTEGFSVTTMEACASGAFPVVSAVDSLGQIYGDHIPMIPAPVRDHISEFTDCVIRALNDSEYRGSVVERASMLAHSHTWSTLARRLEGILTPALKR